MRPISVSTAAYDGYSLDLAIADIATLGARWVEPAYIKGYVEFDETVFSDANAASVAAMLAGSGVGAMAVSAHIDLGLPEAIGQLRARIGFCHGIGAKILITNSSTRERRTQALRTIAAVLPDLESAGVTLALENPGHGTDNLIASATDFAALLGEIDAPLVRANYDIGNIFSTSHEQIDPAEDIVAALPLAVHLHAKDIVSRGNDWSFCAIGDGSIDYAKIRALLDARAPDMPLGIELPLRLDRTGRRDPQRRSEPLELAAIRVAIRRSMDFLTGSTAPR